MDNVVKLWTRRTLEDLRQDADRAEDSIAFDAIRAADSRRIVVAVCVADIDQISRLEPLLRSWLDVGEERWESVTLSDFMTRAVAAREVVFTSVRDEYGRRSALALICATPDSVARIESVFKLC